jgi:hypothetical protein
MDTVRAEVILGLPITTWRWQTAVQITPEKAKAILEHQPAQRPVSRLNVARLKNEIIEGRFRRTHQGLAFDENGLLRDGQHRLMACYEAGRNIEILACFNEPAPLFAHYDNGIARTIGTTLYLAGKVETAKLGSGIVTAAKFIWAYDSGFNPAHPGAFSGAWNYTSLQAIMEDHSGIQNYVKMLDANRKIPYQKGMTAGLFTMFSEVDPFAAQVFIDQCLNGENIKKGDPAYTLRESILGHGNRQSMQDKVYKVARAWNAFHEGRKLANVYGGSRKRSHENGMDIYDEFPEISGYQRPLKKAEKIKKDGNHEFDL